tara:strand:- start:19454 stop:20284 length:831 start_codon:yes stop_codon:yes gene_type:complete
MWIYILLGLAATNVLLLVIRYAGAMGLLCTWLPARTIFVLVTLMYSADIQQEQLFTTMLFLFGSHLIPVVFLTVFRIGMHHYRGRQPRFDTHAIWPFIWVVAIVVLGVGLAGLCVLKSNAILFILGALAAVFNFINVQDMPRHIRLRPIQITTTYLLLSNATVAAMLYAVNVLIENGHEKMVGVLTNMPFISIALLAHSTCASTGTQTTSQHVYMLACQIWPSLVFVLVIILTRHFRRQQSLGIAGLATVIVIGIQFGLFMEKVTQPTPSNNAIKI